MSRLSAFSFVLIISSIAIAQDTTTVAAPAVAEIQIRQIEPFAYCAVEMTGSYSQHDTAFQILYNQTYSQGMGAYEEPFGIYHNSPNDTPEEQLRWEVGLPLDTVKELAPPLIVKKWEFPLVAVKTYQGPMDEQMNAAYGELFQWIGSNGYQPVGPMMEKFMTMPERNENGVYAGTVEISMPVQKVQ